MKNNFYYCILLLCIIACQTHRFSKKSALRQTQKGWSEHRHNILKVIRTPDMPTRDFPVLLKPGTDFWVADCRETLQSAIDTCYKSGGGRVIIPAGNYRCAGPLHLKSNVNLHLEKDALLVFDTLPDKYLPLVKVRWEGTVCWNYSPFIYAFQQKNIALTGEGRINGQALTFWKNWRGRQDPAKKRLRQMGSDRTPEKERRFGEGWWLRPSLIEFYECENVLVEGLTLEESPFWTLHPVFCKNVILRGLHITGGFWNDDGIDPDSCEDVLIEDCTIRTYDDAISIKAGRDQDAWGRPRSSNILVRRCSLRSEKANALCIGSELSGGVEQVFIEKCQISYARYGINLKTNNDRGGYVKNIFIRDIEADTCRESLLFLQTNYHSYRGGNYPTTFSDLFLQNIACHLTDSSAINIIGLPEAPIDRVFLQNIQVQSTGKADNLMHVRGLVHR